MSSIESDSYDVIISNEAFYHSGNHGRLFNDIHRILDKQGVLIFSDIVQKSHSDKFGPDMEDEDIKGLCDELKIESFGTNYLYRQ